MSDLIQRLRADELPGESQAKREARMELGRLLDEAADEIERLRAFIAKPPTHRFYGPADPNCPPEDKAPNGELYQMRCKVCGIVSPRDKICRATL